MGEQARTSSLPPTTYRQAAITPTAPRPWAMRGNDKCIVVRCIRAARCQLAEPFARSFALLRSKGCNVKGGRLPG